MPTSNQAFWETKLAANQRRDALVKQQLAEVGWRVATVWECATRGKDAIEKFSTLLDDLANWIRNRSEALTYESKI